MIFALFFSVTPANAADIYQFKTPQQKTLFWDLTGQLRCVVCQNETLADSNAKIAGDMRKLIYQQVAAGKDKQQVIDFMVQRYGDFVLYDPPFKGKTLVLWLGPFVLLVIALLVLLMVVKRRRSSDAEVSEEAVRAAREILK